MGKSCSKPKMGSHVIRILLFRHLLKLQPDDVSIIGVVSCSPPTFILFLSLPSSYSSQTISYFIRLLIHCILYPPSMEGASDPEREQALEDYKKSLLELREWEAKLRSLRLGIKDVQKEFDITEDNIKALQSVGQIVGEVLKQLDEERCKFR
jgi:hypothetical protein